MPEPIPHTRRIAIVRNPRGLEILSRVDNALGRIGTQQAVGQVTPTGGSLAVHAGPQLPFRPGEQMDNLMASINGAQGYPDFKWVNPAGVDAFLASGPMSTNIEDRRDELGGFDAAAARMRRQGRR